MILHRVGESSPQSISVKTISRHFPVVPHIGNAGRAGKALIVIQEDPVPVDKSELIRIKKELGRTHMRAARPFITEVEVRRQPTFIIAGGKLGAVDFAALVIKGGEDERLAELAFIQR